MSRYRLYLFDALYHAFQQERFSCPDDVKAIDKSQALSMGCAAELWRDDKLIARLEEKKPLTGTGPYAPWPEAADPPRA